MQSTFLCKDNISAAAAESTSSQQTLIECSVSVRPSLVKHVLRTSACSFPCNVSEMEHQIEEGSLYQILHKNLPPKTPIHLKALRAVMVTEKTDMDVTVRFPSASSLKTYFRRVSHKNKNQAPTDGIRPNLDQQFVMGSKVANEVLVRQISSSEFSQQKDHHSFWLVPPRPTAGDPQVSNNSMDRDDQRSNSKSTDDSNNTSVRGSMCLSPELKNQLGLLRWGNRRRVTYVGRHKDMNPGFQSSYFSTPPVKEENEVKPTSEGMEEIEMRVTRKRAREISSRNCVMFKGIEDLQRRRVAEKVLVKNSSYGKRKSSKEKKREKKLKRRKEKNREMIASGEKVVKLSYDRWSKERYKTAEGKMLMILKEKEAVPGRPILRRILRVEARKHIGDTGLLDHLLKHMAGKVSPNGVDRFRRRHNADGEMEYWLESAELVNIRKEAGVNDPFWIPPPGWEPGDNPSQDPICAKELKLLKEEMAEIKRSMQDLVLLRSKEAAEASGVKEIANVAAVPPLITSSSNIVNHLQLAGVHNNNSDTSDHDHKLVAVAAAAATPLNEMCDILMKKKEILEKQLLDITTSLNQFKGEVGKITSTVEEKPMKSTAVVEYKEKREEEEEREAKRQRLRSGFRICKPQGTFLWPNMVGGSGGGGGGGGGSSSTTTVSALSPHQQRSSSSYNQQQQQNHHHHHHHQVVVQVQHEDMNVVPTPPSVSSASSSQLNRLLLTAGGDNGNGRPESPLMKPLAERRAVTVTVTVPGHHHHSQQQQQVMEQCGSGDETDNISTTTNSFPRHNPTAVNRTTPHLLIDLNDEDDSSNMDMMMDETKGFCGPPMNTAAASSVSRHQPPPALLLPQRGGWGAAGGAAGGVKEEVVVLDPNSSSSPRAHHQTVAATTSRVAHELAKEVLPYKMRTRQELKQQQQQQQQQQHIELGLSLGQLGI